MAQAGDDLIFRLRENPEGYDGPRGATRVIPPDDSARDPRRPVRIARGVSLLLAVLAMVGMLQAMVMISIEGRRWWVAAREVARLESELLLLRAETADLRQIAERADDLRFREQLARRQGYVFPDEVRYVIAQPAEADAPTPSLP